jgi:hypothetical protein
VVEQHNVPAQFEKDEEEKSSKTETSPEVVIVESSPRESQLIFKNDVSEDAPP